MKHFGDITKISGYEVPVVDVVTGGSPCQDLSVAGKRAGLAGERSGLFMEQIRIIKEMRKHYVETNGLMGVFRTGKTEIKPRYMVWENVPGALSSNGGEDFRAALEETARIVEEAAVIPGPPKGKWQQCGCIMGNGWSIAWRIHDLQYWGCPQRRRRICLLADFNGDSAGRILFKLWRKTDGPEADETVTDTRDESRPEIQSFTESVPGDFEPCGTEREAVAGDVKGSTGISEQGHPMSVEQAQGWEEASVNDTLNAFDNGESRTPMVMSYQGFADYKESDAASTCKERDYEVATDLVIQKSWDGGDISPTLTANNAGGDQRMPDKDNFNAVVMFTTEPTPKVDEDGRTINIDESECLL